MYIHIDISVDEHVQIVYTCTYTYILAYIHMCVRERERESMSALLLLARPPGWGFGSSARDKAAETGRLHLSGSVERTVSNLHSRHCIGNWRLENRTTPP